MVSLLPENRLEIHKIGRTISLRVNGREVWRGSETEWSYAIARAFVQVPNVPK